MAMDYLNSANRSTVSEWLQWPHIGALARTWGVARDLTGMPGLDLEAIIMTAYMVPTSGIRCEPGCNRDAAHAVTTATGWSLGELPNPRYPYEITGGSTPHSLACIAAHAAMNGYQPRPGRVNVPEPQAAMDDRYGTALASVVIAGMSMLICTVVAGEPMEGDAEPYQLLAEALMGAIRLDLARDAARRPGLVRRP
jgi:hypothetical protein